MSFNSFDNAPCEFISTQNDPEERFRDSTVSLALNVLGPNVHSHPKIINEKINILEESHSPSRRTDSNDPACLQVNGETYLKNKEDMENGIVDRSSDPLPRVDQTTELNLQTTHSPLQSKNPSLVNVDVVPRISISSHIKALKPSRRRLSISSTSSEQSSTSSTTYSFTTGCCSSMTSECSFESTDSTKPALSTIKARRDSTSADSISTVRPHRSSNQSGHHLQSSWLQSALPPDTFLVSRREYKDYFYVLYTDGDGSLWAKMCPKTKTRRLTQHVL